MLPVVTTQIAPLIANAGVTQNVSINSPSSLSFAGGGGGSIPPNQVGPGWATVSGGTATAPTGGVSGPAPTNWPLYVFVAALAYFGLKKLGG